ncbi:MAG: ABC transporter permease [Verrucomicrobia bacterium RIFCSPLOWO2_12_FULL_64_8]|nr:MAG: ABC transporter permease [Verrucomicrobia bacterium RIFCSPLOWO2_12_FULL_64_8]
MPWYLYLALKHLFPTGRRLAFFTAASILGVTLGVAVVIVVICVMVGFGDEIRRKVVETNGHIRIETGGIMYDQEAVMAKVRGLPGVAAVAPYAHGMVMLQAGNRPAFPIIRGIDAIREGGVVPLQRFLLSGRVDDLDDDSVFVSSELAAALQVHRGDRVDVYSPLLLERLKKDEVVLPRELRVAGIFATGWNQVDANTVLCTLRLMQELYGLGTGAHGVSVRLEPGTDMDEAAEAINQAVGGSHHAVTWLQSYRDFLFVIQFEKNILMFVLLFIVLVASFAIMSSLLTAVVRKTREIGLLGALGGKPRQVAACFCLQGLFIGLTGTVLGILLALLGLSFRNEIVHAFQRLTQSEAAMRSAYMFAEMPVTYPPTDLAIIITSSIVIATLAGLLPAWRAARLKPVEALRSE